MPEIIVRERGVSGTARAMFVCLSKKCRDEQGDAITYELPVAATRCSVCGSKRINRLWAGFAPNVSTGSAKTIDAMMETPHAIQSERKDIAAEMNRQAPMFAVHPSELHSRLGLSVPLGSRVTSNVGDAMQERVRPSNSARKTAEPTVATTVSRVVGHRADVRIVEGKEAPKAAQRIDGQIISAALQEQRARTGR